MSARLSWSHWLAALALSAALHAALLALARFDPGAGAPGGGGAGLGIRLSLSAPGSPAAGPTAGSPAAAAGEAETRAAPAPAPPVSAPPAEIPRPAADAAGRARGTKDIASLPLHRATPAPASPESASPARDAGAGAPVAAGPPSSVDGAGAANAAGSGDGAAVGAGRSDSPGLASLGIRYYADVTARVVGALRYPRRARGRGIEGTAVVLVRLDRRGALARASLAESSGSALLDDDALETIRRAAPFEPPPAALGDEQLEFEIPVEYVLY